MEWGGRELMRERKNAPLPGPRLYGINRIHVTRTSHNYVEFLLLPHFNHFKAFLTVNFVAGISTTNSRIYIRNYPIHLRFQLLLRGYLMIQDCTTKNTKPTIWCVLRFYKQRYDGLLQCERVLRLYIKNNIIVLISNTGTNVL